ncbi:cysteine protease family C01A [Achlya hypogyna]|uniref:Cysteine protease family C01A n=1 Tax=Achlya hypogyna TaxID=1202772 RepID=A0A0A7CNG5_ACHHY|nr:secreted protein [Achlya hypogyna]OQR89640.1 cysteine protease family C01A [Achlya hypogyna]
MKTIFLTAVLAVSSCVALQMSKADRDALAEELRQWKSSHAGKSAESLGLLPQHSDTEEAVTEEAKFEDELTRFANSKHAVESLQKHHPDAVFDYKNQFALMTPDEFKAFVKGSFGKDQPKRQLRAENIQTTLTAAQAQAGDKDWTTDKCMPPVKNQGSCGSCWAFATVGASEMAHCLGTGKLLDLSEQQLVSCAKNAGQGCQGGWPNKALDYISQTGLCSAKDYPYTAKDSSCQSSCSKTKLSIGKTVDIQGESAIQSALDKQPISVTVEAGNSVWQYYKGGVVAQCPGAQSDHAVIAVGYGTKDGQQHFKIRNSWGANWGEKGYMYLKRGVGGKGMCNVADNASYPTMTGKPQPTNGPTSAPTDEPTDEPTTDEPSDEPTHGPWAPTDEPSNEPTHGPWAPTDEPSNEPTHGPWAPTDDPSDVPTEYPSGDGSSNSPTHGPWAPTDAPSDDGSATGAPTPYPSDEPTDAPTEFPTDAPRPSTKHPHTKRPHTKRPRTKKPRHTKKPCPGSSI